MRQDRSYGRHHPADVPPLGQGRNFARRPNVPIDTYDLMRGEKYKSPKYLLNLMIVDGGNKGYTFQFCGDIYNEPERTLNTHRLHP